MFAYYFAHIFNAFNLLIHLTVVALVVVVFSLIADKFLLFIYLFIYGLSFLSLVVAVFFHAFLLCFHASSSAYPFLLFSLPLSLSLSIKTLLHFIVLLFIFPLTHFPLLHLPSLHVHLLNFPTVSVSVFVIVFF